MHDIPLTHLLYMAVPMGIVAYFYYKWVNDAKEVGYATVRMVVQLLAIGYVLDAIFHSKSPFVAVAVVLFMVSVSSMIALRNFKEKNFINYRDVFISIFIGGTANLLLVLAFVIDIKPIYTPMVMIPLAGMIYANAMNSVAQAAERFESEIEKVSYEKARLFAFKASMLPRVNVLLAVGLVSLPGLMTGQILSGVSPLIAARYQIVIMSMVIGSSGISSVVFLLFKKPKGTT